MIGHDNIYCLDEKISSFEESNKAIDTFNYPDYSIKQVQASQANIKCQRKINIFFAQEKRSSLMFHEFLCKCTSNSYSPQSSN